MAATDGLSLQANRSFPTRWLLALFFFACGLGGFLSGVEVTERDIVNANAVTLAYYSLGLFILGGMDLGSPIGGPIWGQVLLWTGYFGAPLLTTSAIVDWLRLLMQSEKRWLQNLTDHIILIGTNDLAREILEKLANLLPDTQILVIDRDLSDATVAEMTNRFNVRMLSADFTNEFFLSKLKIHHARLVIIASHNDFDNFEAAGKLMMIRPDLGKKLIIHCNRIRFMREFTHTSLVQQSITFNSFQLAARHLVKNIMMAHFEYTLALDTVVLAGFGRFGQIVLEELQSIAKDEIAALCIIDLDAHRRVLVAEEQISFSDDFKRHVFEGDISHPEVWKNLERTVDLHGTQPLIILATGADDENLRIGLWLKKNHPDAKIMIRSTRPSVFASSVCEDAGIYAFGLSRVIGEALPDEWFKPQE